MKLLEKVVPFETKEQLREWFNLGSASAPRVMMHSTESIIKDGKEVWQTMVHVTFQEAPIVIQNRIGQAFMKMRKEFPNHTIGLTDRAYHKIKFYDPEYRETHPKKRPEKAHESHRTAIADAFTMAKTKKKNKDLYQKMRSYQVGYADRRSKKDPTNLSDSEYMRGYAAREWSEKNEKMLPRGNRGIRKNSMTWILVEYIKNHGGEVTRKHLIEQFGAINGSVISRALKSGQVEALAAGKYIHINNSRSDLQEETAPEMLAQPQVAPKLISAPFEIDSFSRENELLRLRNKELENEVARLKKALVALTG